MISFSPLFWKTIKTTQNYIYAHRKLDNRFQLENLIPIFPSTYIHFQGYFDAQCFSILDLNEIEKKEKVYDTNLDQLRLHRYLCKINQRCCVSFPQRVETSGGEIREHPRNIVQLDYNPKKKKGSESLVMFFREPDILKFSLFQKKESGTIVMNSLRRNDGQKLRLGCDRATYARAMNWGKGPYPSSMLVSTCDGNSVFLGCVSLPQGYNERFELLWSRTETYPNNNNNPNLKLTYMIDLSNINMIAFSLKRKAKTYLTFFDFDSESFFSLDGELRNRLRNVEVYSDSYKKEYLVLSRKDHKERISEDAVVEFWSVDKVSKTIMHHRSFSCHSRIESIFSYTPVSVLCSDTLIFSLNRVMKQIETISVRKGKVTGVLKVPDCDNIYSFLAPFSMDWDFLHEGFVIETKPSRKIAFGNEKYRMKNYKSKMLVQRKFQKMEGHSSVHLISILNKKKVKKRLVKFMKLDEKRRTDEVIMNENYELLTKEIRFWGGKCINVEFSFLNM